MLFDKLQACCHLPFTQSGFRLVTLPQGLIDRVLLRWLSFGKKLHRSAYRVLVNEQKVPFTFILQGIFQIVHFLFVSYVLFHSLCWFIAVFLGTLLLQCETSGEININHKWVRYSVCEGEHFHCVQNVPHNLQPWQQMSQFKQFKSTH